MNANLKPVGIDGRFSLVIGGELVLGAMELDVINPATGKTFVTCARADQKQASQAVAAAKSAYPGWSRMPIGERRQLLNSVADAFALRIDEFAKLSTQESGKPAKAGVVRHRRLSRLPQKDLPLARVQASHDILSQNET
jgi:acyl-CoA reductase-like NAD-dependent aldehyde dehydrogenase